jgi:hypothetical protein
LNKVILVIRGGPKETKMCAHLISILASTDTAFRLRLESYLRDYQSKNTTVIGLLLFSEDSEPGKQCMLEALGRTLALQPQICSVPLVIEEVATFGEKTNSEDE